MLNTSIKKEITYKQVYFIFWHDTAVFARENAENSGLCLPGRLWD